MSEQYFCGPLRVSLRAQTETLRDKVVETLRLYDRRWDGPHRDVEITVRKAGAGAALGPGTFLRCSRMVVDRADDGLRATTLSGAQARSRTIARADQWMIDVPEACVERLTLDDVEDLVNLALVAGWRGAGFVPVHAGSVTRDDRCAIICAPSGGGKSTLTAAFIRRDWHAVGDDKLLLRWNRGGPEIKALQRTFNLHPRTRAWFPEVGELERLPIYSVWTEKRKVRIDAIWPDRIAGDARPTHLLRLRRDPTTTGIRARELTPNDVFRTLIGQIAVPSAPEVARPIMSVAALTARRLRGFEVTIGEDAYRDEDCLAELEAALR